MGSPYKPEVLEGIFDLARSAFCGSGGSRCLGQQSSKTTEGRRETLVEALQELRQFGTAGRGLAQLVARHLGSNSDNVAQATTKMRESAWQECAWTATAPDARQSSKSQSAAVVTRPEYSQALAKTGLRCVLLDRRTAA